MRHCTEIRRRSGVEASLALLSLRCANEKEKKPFLFQSVINSLSLKKQPQESKSDYKTNYTLNNEQ